MRPCEHTSSAPHGLEGAPLAAALAEAERRCSRDHERLTQPRRRALELLLRSGRAIKAYDLIAAFEDAGAPAKPPTVYRALDFLTRQGFAHRVESLGAYVACHMGAEPHLAAFLVCTCCGDTREIEPFEPRHANGAARRHGWALSDVMVEGRGLCPACAGEGHGDVHDVHARRPAA
jgi:Fur family zinc uptake transcriptional regulator